MDEVFRALANPDRRLILDLLKEWPGMNVNELSEHFEFSRFALMKHLRSLQEAGLVVSRREGVSRRLYLNAVPIQTVYDRWISQYSSFWAPRLTRMKRTLELEDEEMGTDLKHVFQLYIRTTPEKLWRAITQPEFTREYFYGTDVHTDLKPGSPIEYTSGNGQGDSKRVVAGEILESVPLKRLVHSFGFTDRDDSPTRVVYELEPMGEMVKLTVVHDGFESKTKTYEDTGGGWPYILSGLKSYLETGEALPTASS